MNNLKGLLLCILISSNALSASEDSLRQDFERFAEILGSSLRCELQVSGIGKSLSEWVESVSEEDYRRFLDNVNLHSKVIQKTGLRADCVSVKQRLNILKQQFKSPTEKSPLELAEWLHQFSQKDPIKKNRIEHYGLLLAYANACMIDIEVGLITIVNDVISYNPEDVDREQLIAISQDMIHLIQYMSSGNKIDKEGCQDVKDVYQKLTWPDVEVSSLDRELYNSTGSLMPFLFARYEQIVEFDESLD